MGRAKQKMIELDAMNLGSIPEKNLCVKHVEDKAIKSFIRKNYETGYCDYCGKKLKVVSLEDLMFFIMEGISFFYEDAANFMSYNSREGGYLGQTYSKEELIHEVQLETEPIELTEDIIDSITDSVVWAEPSSYHGSLSTELIYRWNYFKDVVKHKSRYLFYDYDSTDIYDDYSGRDISIILKEIGKIITQLGLIQSIEPKDVLFRCRQHKTGENISELTEIVSPPVKYAIYPNRFSPSGIPMLYAAFDKETAFSETVDYSNKKNNQMSFGEFKLNKKVNVIDFSKLPPLPSIFDRKRMKKYFLISFLHDLVRDMTEGISRDGKEHIEYVPTQVVTEYFRYVFNKNRKAKIEGLIYPSSKNNPEKAIVIFWDNEECLENLELINIDSRLLF